ncbi:MAG: S-methyl-5-thioribose-1-phosphate isomerase [Fimbriimonadaceae bacterium]|nr:S-methyl-5-thioribose-1-phosphate isomerase [Fimbriimonadaceae bacterium]
MPIRPLRWEDDALWLLDQRLLPAQERWLRFDAWPGVVAAIRDMVVRGAPAIGIAAAYGMALAARAGERNEASRGLAASRPTAVNLFWALDRMARVTPWTAGSALAEARAIEEEDRAMNRAIGRNGADLLKPGSRVLTICNTGGLATSEHGTALGVVRTAWERDRDLFVIACETRPRLQGMRLTAWELMRDGIPFRLVPDSAAASLMRAGTVDFVIAGADRIAANGDTANKIGTYALAVLARHHGIPFAIAAPTSTIDPSLETGDAIPIEHRGEEEVTTFDGVRLAPEGCPVLNPAFDVTPGSLIDWIVTERETMPAPFDFRKPSPV